MHSLVKCLAVSVVVLPVLAGCASSEESPVGGDTSNLTSSAPGGADKVTLAHGNEPFWNVTISPTTVKFEMLDDVTMTIDNRGPIPAAGVTPSYAVLYQGRTKEDPNKFLNVMITATEGGCSDMMSDELYPYTVSVLSGDQFFTGCGH